jgi:hypothetical protein
MMTALPAYISTGDRLPLLRITALVDCGRLRINAL